MAIAKRPGRNRADVEKFISGGRAGDASKKTGAKPDDKRVPIVIRVPGDLLAKIDRAAKARGVSRAAWLCVAASKAVDAGE